MLRTMKFPSPKSFCTLALGTARYFTHLIHLRRRSE